MMSKRLNLAHHSIVLQEKVNSFHCKMVWGCVLIGLACNGEKQTYMNNVTEDNEYRFIQLFTIQHALNRCSTDVP